MIRSMWTSKSGMQAQQIRLDTISNNLANSQTMGYKKVDTSFKDLYSESLDRLGTPLNNKDAIMGTGVKTSDWYRDNSQGYLQDTMRPTDLAIDGEGYFRIVHPDGSYSYTRDGAFKVDGEGRLVDGRGNKVYLEYTNGKNEGNVQFTNSNFLVDTKGSVFVKQGDTFLQVGRIPTYTAIGDNAFLPIGENLYASGEGVQVFETNDCDIYQGLLEGSNVDMGEEFTEMILTQRAFQMSSKGVQTADEMWGMINNMRR